MIFLKYIAKGLVWFIALMPFFILYGISDIVAFIMQYIWKYRKQTIDENLANAFPEKTKIELKKIKKQFYRNFSDLIFEIIKERHITKAQILKRIEFQNMELIEGLYDKKRSIIANIGHCGNWEWMAIAMSLSMRHKGFAVAKPLSDSFFNKYLWFLRTRLIPGHLINFKDTFKVMKNNRHELCLTIIAGDQTPTRSEIEYWTLFLNQPTPVFLGSERIAKALNQSVIYLDIYRKKRGYYVVETSMLFENPKETATYEITNKHVAVLEEKIKQRPDNWLWSHRRWKHKDLAPENMKLHEKNTTDTK